MPRTADPTLKEIRQLQKEVAALQKDLNSRQRDLTTRRHEIESIQKRITHLSSERPGRKPKPLVAIRQRDVCAIDPTRDSTSCPDASIYRYQSGCHGVACRQLQHDSYAARRQARKAAATSVAIKAKADPNGTKTMKRTSKRAITAA